MRTEEQKRADRADRYQYQSWVVRRWRDRYLLAVPFKALRMWWANRHRTGDDALPWDHAWSIARGLADVSRNYVYDFRDLNENLSVNERGKRRWLS